MCSRDQKAESSGGFFSAIGSWGSAMQKSVSGLLGYEGLEVINPEGSTEDAKAEAQRGRWRQLMEDCHLLDLADESVDPYMRLVYASSWAISVYFAYQMTWKPFNPILGETFDMVNHNRITFIAEQVSHHPPMSAAHADNELFTYDVISKLKTKFLGNSVEVYPVGSELACLKPYFRWTRVTLKKSSVVLDLVPPPTKVNNLIFGRTWVDSPGDDHDKLNNWG